MGTPTTAGIRIPRIYLCGNNNCRLEFIKKLVSLVTKCPRCEYPSYDRDFDPELEKLDWLSERHEKWYKYPQLHIEHIRSRTIEDGRTVVRSRDGLIVDKDLDSEIPI